MAVEDAVAVEPVGEFPLKGIRRPLAAHNVLAAKAANYRAPTKINVGLWHVSTTLPVAGLVAIGVIADIRPAHPKRRS